MAWEHLALDTPHIVYIILGGYTTLFMLCSSFIKEKLYIGEATVATLVGIIFGPIAAGLVNPLEWGNSDFITLEFSRIVLVVQCFAVGVELPKLYMNKHWLSVTLLLVPVMTFGWLITSLFIWWLFRSHLNWLDSLVIAACVTATDPVLASSVVGKGKFAKRVPKHLRDLLSAESGCNDGMAFPFIYLGVYLIRYHQDAGHVTFHWICYTILYECLFGAVFGVVVGYAARRAIRYAHEHDLIDRESFLVFYFVLALFCAGAGSILGLDDLLVGFACGVGFSNDGWFQEKTEETHVSNVIDLLLNLAFFVYFGMIIPWNQFNSDIIGIHPWKLIVLAIFVLLFRRIPIMMMLKPVIPDIKTWREALFAGHFGPIGVGAIFVAILARAELETESTTPLAVLPEPDFPHMNIIEMIWPITTFLVLCSIVVHGSSIAVFTLGRHLNTLTITFSYTTADEGPSWMERLPRIQSRSKSSMSLRRPGESETSLDEKAEMAQAGGLTSPLSVPRNFLRRQKEEDNPSRPNSRSRRKRNKWDSGIGPGGPISQSAITPASRLRDSQRYDSGDLADQSPSPDGEPGTPGSPVSPKEEIYDEGDHVIIEDEDGSVEEVRKKGEDETDRQAQRRAKREARQLLKEREGREGQEGQDRHEEDDRAEVERGKESEPGKIPERPGWRGRLQSMRRPSEIRRPSESGPVGEKPRHHGPARAYTFGNTVIVEDEDGEVIKTYQIPSTRPGQERRPTIRDAPMSKATRDMLTRMGTYLGAGREEKGSQEKEEETTKKPLAAPTDDNIRFTFGEGGPRLRKDEFIKQLSKLDTRTRARVVEGQDAPEPVKREVHRRASNHNKPILERRPSTAPADSRRESNTSLDHTRTTETIPGAAVVNSLAHYTFDRGGQETAAQRRRNQASEKSVAPTRQAAEDTESESEVEDDGPVSRSLGKTATGGTSYLEEGETAAEYRRRQAALGMGDDDSSSDDEGGTGFREPKPKAARRQDANASGESSSSSSGNGNGGGQRAGIRFAEPNPRNSGPRLRWGEDVKKA